MATSKAKIKSVFICLILLLAKSPIALARDVIVFSCAIEKSTPQYLYLYNLYRDAFDMIDLDFSMQHSSNVRRNISSAASGQVDGECGRLIKYTEFSGTSNLIQLDTAVISTDIQAWSRSPVLSVSSMKDVYKAGSRIGYRRGLTGIKIGLSKQELAITAVNKTELGLKMLAASRIDLYIGASILIKNNIENLTFKQKLYLSGTLSQEKLYPLLHQQHLLLAVPLAAELKRQIDKRGGTIK